MPYDIVVALRIELALRGEAGDKIGVQSEQGLIKRVRLVPLHPPQAGEQQLLEELRLEISDGELEQSTGNGLRCRLRVRGRPAVTRWQAGGDPVGQARQVLVRTAAEHGPGLLVLKQPTHVVELGAGEIDRGPGRGPHQAAQVVRTAYPAKPSLGRTGEFLAGPGHRQADGRRATGPDHPRERHQEIIRLAHAIRYRPLPIPAGACRGARSARPGDRAESSPAAGRSSRRGGR